MDETKPDSTRGMDFWKAMAELARDLRGMREAIPQIRACLGDPEGRRQAVELLVTVGRQAGQMKLAEVLRAAAAKLSGQYEVPPK